MFFLFIDHVFVVWMNGDVNQEVTRDVLCYFIYTGGNLNRTFFLIPFLSACFACFLISTNTNHIQTKKQVKLKTHTF